MEHELRTQLEAQRLSELRAARVAVRRRAQRGLQRRRSDAGADGQGLREHHRAAARAAGATSISTIELMREQLAAGLAQPAIVVDLTLDQVPRRAGRRRASRRCSRAFRRFPSEIPLGEQERLRAQAVRGVRPAVRRRAGRDSRRSCATPIARRRARRSALTSLKDGRSRLRRADSRSTRRRRMTAEQIHQLGLQEVARIEKEMERLARADGFTGPVTEYEKQLGQRSGMRFTCRRR